MNLHCICGCGLPLLGKQRQFRSDACRKRYQRANSDNGTVRESAKNDDPVIWKVDIGPFADMIKSENTRRHLVECLHSTAEYEETWCKRILAHPGHYAPGQLEKHQFANEFINQLVDGLVNWGATEEGENITSES